MVQTRRPLMLTILDGWGYSKVKEGNAVLAARTPNLDLLEKEYLSGCLKTQTSSTIG
jgi:2,3-bisphosphoglycerate-independent phosphoglycerate mutase